MGVSIDHSPIAHPELAGEGIEYDWGFSKLLYCRHPLADKKKKEKFRELVRKCISRESITIEMRRKFSRRAREYIGAYRALSLHRAAVESLGDGEGDGEQEQSEIPSMSAQLIEKVVKLYKSHRNIIDQEKGWIKNIMLLMYQ